MYHQSINLSKKKANIFIEVRDEANGVSGMIASPPMPVDRDYPILPLSPDNVKNFQAQAGQSDIALNWTNPLNADFVGTLIRCSTTDFPANPMDGAMVYDGNGATATHNSGHEGTVYYTAFTYDVFGNYSSGQMFSVDMPTGVAKNDESLPARFKLCQNYPNPFNPQTSISYQLPVFSKVTLKVYDVLGQEVRTLVSENMPVGYHSVVWDGRNELGRKVTSGIYFYRLKAGDNFSQVKKLSLLE